MSHNSVNITGKTFGRLKVLRRVESPVVELNPRNKKSYWECECICGTIKILCYNSVAKKDRNPSCGCKRYITGKENFGWKGYEEISGEYWYRIVERSATRGNEYLSIEDAWEIFTNQNRKCALSKVEIHFGKGPFVKKGRRSELQTASLDRIDSSIGYIKSNVQWVHKTVNLMKNALTQDEFITWCTLIAKNNQGY